MADLDHRLGDALDRGEQPVDEVRTFDQHLQLTATAASGGQERFRVLEVVVEGGTVGRIVAHGRRDDLFRRQGRTVVDGDHANSVVGILNDHGGKAVAIGDDGAHLLEQGAVVGVELDAVDLVMRDDDELRQVDGVGALAQDLALRTFLAAGFEEMARVLVVGRLDIARQGLCRLQRDAVTGEDVADLALRDRHQRLHVQAELEREEEVVTAAQDTRLEAGFALQGDQAGGDGAFRAPQFFDDGGVIVADIADHS